MPKQLLIETRMNALTLCESVEHTTRPGCLGTLKGPCADFVNPTRNSNLYSRKLWENVFNDTLVKEALECKVLIGELDHPGDRLETKASEAAIVMTDYSFNDPEGVVEGTFDILDTPKGRVLKSLIDYGCRVGVSSRGEGDVEIKDISTFGEVNVIDEDTYYFVGFDAVLLPAALKAKPTLVESVQHKKLSESLASQIGEASTQSELDTIKKVIEITNLPDSDSLIESVDHKSKELEGANSTSRLLEDLEESSQHVVQLEEQVKSLKKEVVNYKSRLKRFLESRLSLIKSERELDDQCESLKGENSRMKFSLLNQTKLNESLQSEIDRLNSESGLLREKLDKSRESQTRLKKEFRQLRSKGREDSLLIESLRNELTSSEKQVKSLERKIDSNTSKFDKEKSSLTESLKRTSSSYRDVLVSYAKREMSKAGVPESREILEGIKSGKGCQSLDDVDRLLKEAINRQDRYRRLGTVEDPLINALSRNGARVSLPGVDTESSEDKESRRFMENYFNL